jgi:hypothetical protein
VVSVYELEFEHPVPSGGWEATVNAREAYAALLEGKHVRRSPDAELFYRMDEHGRIWGGWGNAKDYVLKVALEGDFELYEEPLTDEQLIAEWNRLASAEHIADDRASTYIAKAYELCAKQLRERKL